MSYHLAYSLTYVQDSQPKYFFFHYASHEVESQIWTRETVDNDRRQRRQSPRTTADTRPREWKTIIPTGSRINDSTVPCGTMFFDSVIRYKYLQRFHLPRLLYLYIFIRVYIFKWFSSCCSAGRAYCCRHCSRGRHCTPPPPSSRSHSSDSAALLSSSAAVMSI